MKNDLEYCKWILTFMLMLVWSMFLFMINAKADVYYGNGTTTGSNRLSYSAYTTLNSGQKNFFFGTSRVYGDLTLVPTWFKITFCVDNTVSNFSGYPSGVNNSLSNVSFYLTDIKCNYPNTNYDKGRVMYLYGQFNLSSACSVNGTNCVNTGKVVFNNDNQSSWVILNEEYKLDGINIDFGANQGGSNSSTIINQNDTIIHQNEETNDKLDDINDTLNDSSIDTNSMGSSSTDWANKNSSNSTITNLLTLPISFLQRIVSGFNGTCHSINLGTLFGTELILPCINIGNMLGGTLWTTIDILFSGLMIFAIAKKLIRIFNDFTNLKDNQINDIYGGGA